jgi:hypothetical protein
MGNPNTGTKSRNWDGVWIVEKDIWDTVRREDLPESMQSLADLIGIKAVASLFRTFAPTGGKRLYIPKKVRAEHPIAVAVGMENFERLSFDFGGLWIDFPSCDRFFKKERNAAIVSELSRLRQEGRRKTEAIFEVAKRFDLSAAAIKEIARNWQSFGADCGDGFLGT